MRRESLLDLLDRWNTEREASRDAAIAAQDSEVVRDGFANWTRDGRDPAWIAAVERAAAFMGDDR